MLPFAAVLRFAEKKQVAVMDAENVAEVLEMTFGRKQGERALNALAEAVY